MKRKRMFPAVVVALALIIVLLGFWYGQYRWFDSSGERIVLKAADDHELSYPTTQGLVRMGDLLKEWTRGRITVQVYHSVRPIHDPEDIRKMNIRVQKAEIMSDIVHAVGANPVKMAFEEVYTGLQTGVIQGAENNVPSWITKGHYEVAKYYTRTAHVYTPEIILFSAKTWQRLSERDRELIHRAARESVPYQRELWKHKVEESLEKAREAGCEIIEEVDREAFRRASKEVYDQHAEGLKAYISRIRAAGR